MLHILHNFGEHTSSLCRCLVFLMQLCPSALRRMQSQVRVVWLSYKHFSQVIASPYWNHMNVFCSSILILELLWQQKKTKDCFFSCWKTACFSKYVVSAEYIYCRFKDLAAELPNGTYCLFKFSVWSWNLVLYKYSTLWQMFIFYSLMTILLFYYFHIGQKQGSWSTPEFLTISLMLCPSTLKWRVNLAACIRNILLNYSLATTQRWR